MGEMLMNATAEVAESVEPVMAGGGNPSVVILGGIFALAFVVLSVGAVVKMVRSPGRLMVGEPPPLPDGGKVATWWCRPLDLGPLFMVCGLFLLFAVSQHWMAKKEINAAEALNAMDLLTGIMVFAVLVAMLVVLVRRRVSVVAWLGLRWREWPHVMWMAPLAVVVMWGVLIGLSLSGYMVWMEKWLGTESTQDAVKILRESKDVTGVALMAFSAVVVAPLAEEVIFRGYLYPVAKRFAGPWVSAVFVSLVFAAGHGNVPLMAPLFLLAMIMTWAYERTGSLWSAIGIHFCFNAATVIMQLAVRVMDVKIPENM
jgi:membrane protease YdiL (CAAX protease family)